METITYYVNIAITYFKHKKIIRANVENVLLENGNDSNLEQKWTEEFYKKAPFCL